MIRKCKKRQARDSAVLGQFRLSKTWVVVWGVYHWYGECLGLAIQGVRASGLEVPERQGLQENETL